jgi:hypothetical protein
VEVNGLDSAISPVNQVGGDGACVVGSGVRDISLGTLSAANVRPRSFEERTHEVIVIQENVTK